MSNFEIRNQMKLKRQSLNRCDVSMLSNKIFDNVLSLEEFGLTKSDKALFTKLAEISSVSPSDCVVIDDSVNAIKTAKSAGLNTIGIYEQAVSNTWEEMQLVADKTIKSFKELL
jgi:FMN phosphatase YigB (HAD superfamily)